LIKRSSPLIEWNSKFDLFQTREAYLEIVTSYTTGAHLSQFMPNPGFLGGFKY